MKVKAPTTLLAAIAFAVLLFPGAAIARARPASRQTPPQVSEQFTLSATNGYEVGVSVTNRRRLILSAHKFTDVLEAASYSLRVQPRHGSDHVVARLGRLGRIDVRFVPGKVHREKPPRGCHGPATVIEQGHFVGVIMFHGARGFTEAHARRAIGAVTRTPPLSCPRVAPPPNPKKLLHKIEALEHEQKAEEAESEEEAGTESLAVKLSATAREGHVNLMAFKSAIREGHAKGFALTTIAVFGHRQRGRIKEEGAAAHPVRQRLHLPGPEPEEAN